MTLTRCWSHCAPENQTTQVDKPTAAAYSVPSGLFKQAISMWKCDIRTDGLPGFALLPQELRPGCGGREKAGKVQNWRGGRRTLGARLTLSAYLQQNFTNAIFWKISSFKLIWILVKPTCCIHKFQAWIYICSKYLRQPCTQNCTLLQKCFWEIL